MLLRTSGILTSRKKKVDVCHERYCSSWIMCVKGFVYRFIYVRVREKMAGKVNRHPDSVFDGLPNRYFIFDFEKILEENK